MIKWSRLITFLVIVAVILGMAGTTSKQIWTKIPLGLDLQGGFDVLYQIQDAPGKKLDADGVKATVAALTQRANGLGVSEPSIDVEGTRNVRVQLAGVFDQAQARKALTTEAKLEFKAPDGEVLLTGADLKSNAAYEADPNTGKPDVSVEFKNPVKFDQVTKTYLGKGVAIYLNGRMLSDPVISSEITNGKAVITGMSSIDEATNLAKLLNAGALPFPLKQISSVAVGPSLGADALHHTLEAGVVGIVVIFLFMIAVYRVPGVIACVALVAYMFLLLCVFAGLHVTLTLPGLAALVLGVGMAVDANIITYERVKDELRNGRSLLSSVISGSRRALRTIIDSNLTTLIAGAVMYWFGTGTIRGFGVALMVSIVVSLLTAAVLSRYLLLLFTRSNCVRNTRLFGVKGGASK